MGSINKILKPKDWRIIDSFENKNLSNDIVYKMLVGYGEDQEYYDIYDFISKDSNFSLALSKKEVMELIGCKDDSTFELSFKPYLKSAEISYGKSSVKWSRDLVIEWFSNPRNLQVQRRGK